MVPPGEFNVTILVALQTYSESFTMTAATVNHSLATLQTLLLSLQLFAVAATLKSIDYNVAMTFILNNNNNNMVIKAMNTGNQKPIPRGCHLPG